MNQMVKEESREAPLKSTLKNPVNPANPRPIKKKEFYHFECIGRRSTGLAG